MGPLDGLKVIDLTHVMAGPTCTLMLADMGADVIKVERIPGGDDTPPLDPADDRRAIGRLHDDEPQQARRGAGSEDRGRQARALRRLLRDADVLVENYRPGTLAKLGFDYEDLRRDNPGLIYCALSGFGRTGPYGHRGGFDLVAQAMSGIMSITGEGPGRPPVKCGAPLTDITCGIIAAMGVLAAYAHRPKTGRGQMVDTSLLEAGIVQTYWQSAIALATGKAPGPMGSAHPLNAPYQAFETADGWIVIGGSNQRNWLRMLEALEAAAPRRRSAVSGQRRPHGPSGGARGGAGALLQGAHQRGPARPASRRAACRPARSTTSTRCTGDPQVLARRMVVEVEHARLGPVRTIGLPVKFADTPGEVSRGAPLFGQHTREVLREHGFTDAEIDGSARRGRDRRR